MSIRTRQTNVRLAPARVQPTSPPMSTQQWIEYLNREIEKRKWCVDAKAFAEGLQQREAQQVTAEAARA